MTDTSTKILFCAIAIILACCIGTYIYNLGHSDGVQWISHIYEDTEFNKSKSPIVSINLNSFDGPQYPSPYVKINRNPEGNGVWRIETGYTGITRTYWLDAKSMTILSDRK